MFLSRRSSIKSSGVVLAVVLVCLCAVAGYGGTTVVSYQVSGGADDGYAWGAAEQDIVGGYLKIGDGRDYSAPYYMSGMRFGNVEIPRSASIVDARLRIKSLNDGTRGQVYGVIEAEAVDAAADFSSRYIADANRTGASVDWDHKFNWAVNTWQESNNISVVIQEIVERPGWSTGNSLALFYSTRTDSDKDRQFGSFEAGSAAILEVTYETYAISGYVKTSGGSGLDGVSVSAGAEIEGAVTNGSGYYELAVPPGWSGRVTPSKVKWDFNPTSRSYSNVTSDLMNEDFGAIYVGVTVKADGTGDYPTIQAAIDAVSNGEVVILEAGTFTGDGNRDIDFNGKAITVRGATGDPNDCVIDCQGTEAEPHRGFNFVSSETSNSVLESLTIKNGYGPNEDVYSNGGAYSSGGAICCDNSMPTILNCIMTNNSASYGGAVYNHSGGPLIEGCILSSNSGSWGGAVFNISSDPTIRDCNITGNSSSSGGGVHNHYSSPIMVNCTIKGNSAESSGGGIYSYKDNGISRGCSIIGNSATSGGGMYIARCSALIENCTINSNSASYGAGMYVFRGSPTIQGCTLSRNSAISVGGGLRVYYYSNTNIENCIISDNSAAFYSGIYSEDNCFLNIRNSAIYNNFASKQWGGIVIREDCHSTIENCTIAENYGGGIYAYDGSSSNLSNCVIWENSGRQISGLVSARYCCIQDWTGGGIGNITDDPLFALDDYHLTGSSPCIDAGDPNYIVGLDETDIDGDPRVIVRMDMGVDEFFSANQAAFYLPVNELQFTALQDRSNPETQSLIIRNYGLADLDWSISEDCSWVQVNPPSGTIAFEGQAVVDVNVDITGINAGDHNCVLIVADPGAENSPMSVEVHLEITGPELSIDVNEFNFQCSKETLIPPEQFLTVTNATTGGTLSWNITKPNDCNWLVVDPIFGSCTTEPNTVSLSIDVNYVEYGSYSCELTVSDPNATNSPQIVTVHVEVLRPSVGVIKTSFYFTAHGKSDTSVGGQGLVITNSGYDTLNWHIEMPNDCNWLSVSPLAGQVADGNSVVVLTVDASKAPVYGYNYCTFNIVDENAWNSPEAVEVNLDVLGPVISAAPSVLEFVVAQGGANPADQVISIQNIGYDTLNWEISLPNDCGWLAANPMMGESTVEANEVVLYVDSAGLEHGFYGCNLTISDSNAGNSPVTVAVGLSVFGTVRVPADYLTIQAAIDAAVNGDEIILEPGVYTGLGNFYIDFKGKAITVRSLEPNDPAIVAATIIDANTGYPKSYGGGFYFHSGEGPNSVLDGVTITTSYFGGGIDCYDASPTIRNCVVRECWGGGIYLWDSNAAISNCVLIGNVGSEGCGGISCGRGSPTISNCVVVGNYSFYGAGGISCYQSGAVIENCTIGCNQSGLMGGGIGVGYDSNVVVTNCIVWDNNAPDGRQIACYSDSSTLTVSYSDVEGGEAAVYVAAGCILNWETSSNIDTGPLFVREPNDGGDGWWDNYYTPDIDESANNDYGDVHLKSEAGRWRQPVYTNLKADWWDPRLFAGVDVVDDQIINLLDFAVVADSWEEAGEGIAGDLSDDGVVDFSDLELVLDNYLVGYVPGAWVVDEVTSPCVDAGDPNFDWTGELWPHGKRINIGAYGGTAEASMSLSTVGNRGDLDGDDTVDSIDLRLFVSMWLAEQAPVVADINHDNLVNFLDFAWFAEEWLWEQ